MSDKIERILYVEDDQDIADVTIMTLEDLGGYDVKHCISGLKALEEIEEYEPDLVLLDVMMPGIDGAETFKCIKQNSNFEKLPVIFITAKSQKNEQEHYVSIGGSGVITKPFDPMTLCSTIETIYSENIDD